MALQTYPAVIDPSGLTFTAQVPGQYAWRVLSVLAHASRANGGTGTRTFQLAVNAGALLLFNTAAVDGAPDPGVIAVCFAPVLTGQTVLASDGAITIPITDLELPAGYTVTGAILNPVVGDVWTDALVWVDQTPTL